MKWLKSSFSEASGNACVEVAVMSPGGIALRESDSPAIVLSTSPAALRALLLRVRAGAVESPRP
ncbi:DUF397 domain-containing protein [Streptomyces flavidovirens]|uniref:DUF397 domain-containing protein n=1 Tax=Streptomyces flavidovirens TaxID=67298 RepID=A0ABW6RAI7_9ACTN